MKTTVKIICSILAVSMLICMAAAFFISVTCKMSDASFLTNGRGIGAFRLHLFGTGGQKAVL